jgi:hypothetical protein
MSKRRHRPGRSSSHGDLRPFDGLRQLTPQAAGGDIGAHAIMAGVPDGEDQQLVRAFGPSTAARAARAHWGVARGRQTGARAAPGVYWRPLVASLAAPGLLGGLSRAASLQHVPGRQRDGLDGPWMQTLHRDGGLAAAVRPDTVSPPGSDTAMTACPWW